MAARIRPDGARWPRRAAPWALAAAGAIVALLVAAVLLLDARAVSSRVAALVLPRLSAALGREVTLREADLDLLPPARVSLAGLTVAGRAGEPALVAADALDVEVALWPLLRSLGREVEVGAVTLVRPTVNLVRAPDGSWSHEGLGGGAAGAPEPTSVPSEPAGGATRVAIDRVRIRDGAIRVVDRSRGGDGDAAVALSDLDLEARGVGPGLPFELRVGAALASEAQNVSASLSVARLPDGIPARPEDWPAVQGSLALGPLALQRLRALFPGELGAVVRGGTARIDASVSTRPDGAYALEGTGELRDVRLRGQAASGRFRAKGSWSPARPAAARLDVTDLALRGPGVDLGGHASIETEPPRAWFVVTGPLLDLDALMGALPEGDGDAPEREPGGDLLPAATRARLRAAAARGTVAIAEVRSGRLRLTDVRAKASLSGGVLALDALEARAFGGTVSAGGTKVALGEREPSWTVAARLDGLQAGEALQAFGGAAPLTGRVGGRLDLAGKGTEWARLRQIVTGAAALSFADGALTTTDLGDRILAGTAAALERAGRRGAAGAVAGAQGGRTTFRDLSGSFDVKDGFLETRTPLELDTPAGPLSLGGRVGLDGRLALEGTAAVPRSALAAIAPGMQGLPRTLAVPVAIGGALDAPTVSIRAEEAVAGLVAGEARRLGRRAADRARGEAEQRGREAAEEVLDRLRGSE
jgi:AsmA protein